MMTVLKKDQSQKHIIIYSIAKSLDIALLIIDTFF